MVVTLAQRGDSRHALFDPAAGNGMRPSTRGRGRAAWALGKALHRAHRRGMSRCLITCKDHNLASARVIERHGGALEDVRDTELGRIRRYWVELPVDRSRNDTTV
ncbi:hypothetical protein Vqi01_37100 [Micromonospora qiuiae]|uniref:N-acetyltransferase domain-containing protein n=2 Tax=Micromonospora qiuiae TaxID=502268 RepID=A0ABQ4JEL9_9ACTN|nr:hypothetical protein Vqi01_37100 [Micromonospora qiuiae]